MQSNLEGALEEAEAAAAQSRKDVRARKAKLELKRLYEELDRPKRPTNAYFEYFKEFQTRPSVASLTLREKNKVINTVKNQCDDG